MKLVVDEAPQSPTEPVSPGKVTVQRAGRPTAGVIAGVSKPGHVAREFLCGATPIGVFNCLCIRLLFQRIDA